MIKAALFDMDGTLIDSMPLWDDIGDRYLRGRGLSPRPGLRATLKSMSMLQGAAYFRNAYGVTDAPEIIIRDYCLLAARAYGEEVLLKDGAEALLAFLDGRGVKMCLATANERSLMEAASARLGIGRYFSRAVTCRELGAGKDTPDFFLRACAMMDAAPEETMLFDDALHALVSASRAGLRTCAVYDASAAQDAEAIRRAADHYVTRLDEAIAFLP